MTSVEAWNSTDGLPRQFLSSLRILFDILDEKKCGYVRLQDIETRWHDEGVKGLPSGVTDALRKVAPQNGYLSFERFVSGLKLALLTSKTKSDVHVSIHDKENVDLRTSSERQAYQTDNSYQRERQHRQKLLSASDNTQTNQYNSNVLHSSTNHIRSDRSQSSSAIAAVRPNNAHFKISSEARRNPSQDQKTFREVHSASNIRPPPRPERTSPHKPQEVPPKIPPRGDTSRMIINELKNWQRRMNTGQQDKTSSHISQEKPQNAAQADIYVNISQLNVSDHTPTTSSHVSSIKRRDSARRHTLTSGVDANMLKRAKQLDDEKQILMQGLAMVDQARTWYIKQIRLLEEKQKYIGKASHSDYNLEAMQERMNFEKARIAEVNHQIKTLIDSTEKGFPLHMNLAMTSGQQMEQNTIKLIKDQNRQLTKEIGQKADRITQLEQEKAQLVRELFEAQSRNKVGYDDTTFS